MNEKFQTDGRGRHNTITMWITPRPGLFMVVKIRCFPATYLEALLTSMSSNSQWKKKKKIISFKKALEDNMTPTVNKCVKLKSKLQLKCFSFLKRHLLGCINHRINYNDQGQWPLNTTADFGGIPLLILSDVLTRWMTLKGDNIYFLNSFIQIKYLLTQIKIIIIPTMT